MTEWIKEKIDVLMVELNDGKSSRDIAKTLSEKFDEKISRNAVLGKLNRMKIHVKHHPVPKKTEKKRGIIRLASRRTRTIKWEKEPPSLFRCSIHELREGRCHWPLGDEPPFEYCGASAINGKPYCYFHHQVSLRRDRHDELHER